MSSEVTDFRIGRPYMGPFVSVTKFYAGGWVNIEDSVVVELVLQYAPKGTIDHQTVRLCFALFGGLEEAATDP